MSLSLRIDNQTHLEDGGPVEFSTDKRGFEIGRDPSMDWTLPDPNRFVSSCHIEIRYENGDYYLYDVSTNGTFINGGSMRVKSPHHLQQGDKLQIGHYLVIVSLGAGAPAAPAPPPAPAFSSGFPAASGFDTPTAPSAPSGGGGDIWSMGGGASTPEQASFDPRPRPAERLSDFGDQHIPVADFGAPAPSPQSPPQEAASPFGNPAPEQAAAFGTAARAGSPFAAPPAQAPAQPSAFGAPPATSPFDTPPASPFGSQGAGASPFGSAPAAPASPFGSPPPQQPQAPPVSQRPAVAEGSPFGAPEHTAPPEIPRPAPPPAQARRPEQVPPSEGFGAPATRSAPQQPVAPNPAQPADDSALLRALCEGAGMQPNALSGVDPTALGYEIGQSLRIMTAELAGLLRARAAAKKMVKSGSRTMLEYDANNPMKFIPTAGEALEVMFGPGRPGYQRGARAVQASFDDVKKHQFALTAAMQPALARLIEDLSPESVESKVESSRFTSKAAKAWEIYVDRWDSKTHPYENGMLDVFLAYFSDAYDDASKGE
ncbi:MAG: type VI secretion system protein ImpI [Paracoccaceae bacterium]|jgi:type VI secretion system protein ImpI